MDNIEGVAVLKITSAGDWRDWLAASGRTGTRQRRVATTVEPAQENRRAACPERLSEAAHVTSGEDREPPAGRSVAFAHREDAGPPGDLLLRTRRPARRQPPPHAAECAELGQVDPGALGGQ
jgi:hypothetical protein